MVSVFWIHNTHTTIQVMHASFVQKMFPLQLKLHVLLFVVVVVAVGVFLERWGGGGVAVLGGVQLTQNK